MTSFDFRNQIHEDSMRSVVFNLKTNQSFLGTPAQENT